MIRTLRKHKGIVAIATVVALPFIALVSGMSIDAGRAYLVQAKLFAAVDAASISAARAVADGESDAVAAANKFFAANFPEGFHKSTATLENVNFSYDSDGNISISISASADMPTTFLNITGFNAFAIGAQAEVIRRPVDLVLVVDNTTSLRIGSIGDVTQDVIVRSKSFVSNFHETFDRVSLVKFAFGAEVPVGFTDPRGHDRTAINSEIDAFTFGSIFNPQYTNASEGFYLALEELRNVSDPANLKVIVFFTDGAPNTFSSSFEFIDSNTYAGSIRSSDGGSGTPRGLWEFDSVATQLSGSGYAGSNIDDNLEELPEYFNSHDISATEFNVLNPFHPTRPVAQYNRFIHSANDLYTRVNRVSRNLVEDMAEAARNEGIFVFTLGLGSSLTSPAGPDSELGQDLLLRMANDPDMLNDVDLSGDFQPDQMRGVYCHAVDEDALEPCFDEMLDVIIRLTL
ncbi:VWA domain-containing protein [Vibrio profundum]|uniref:VWA domain-containing protein n=1 Tax=Vibrio profundum TaxID=2910247 RepID=UPI003D0FCDEF